MFWALPSGRESTELESTLPDRPGLPNERHPEDAGSLNLPVSLKDAYTNHPGASQIYYNIQLTNVPQML